MYLSKRYNIPTNKYKVKAGQDQVRQAVDPLDVDPGPGPD